MKEAGRNSKKEERQNQILQAALKVFLKKGFSGATTREIASEAGVSEGTLFRYFDTKKDILIALANSVAVGSLKNLMQHAADSSDEEILRALLKNRLRVLNENRELIRLLLTEAQFHPEVKEKFVEQVVLKAAAVLEQFMEERITQGVYRSIDPGIATRAFAGMMGMFVMWREFFMADKYVSFNDDAVVESVVEIFLNGIRKDRERGVES